MISEYYIELYWYTVTGNSNNGLVFFSLCIQLRNIAGCLHKFEHIHDAKFGTVQSNEIY